MRFALLDPPQRHSAILHSITHLLSSNPYVIVIALDFSKAFDTVRHAELFQKLTQLLPDEAYNWMVDFFSGHCYCTKYAGATSESMGISASIIQGSAIGPVTYIVNAADLKKTVTDGNQMHKYADDTYIILPTTNSYTRETELKNVEQWGEANNLKLNRAKSLEIIAQ